MKRVWCILFSLIWLVCCGCVDTKFWYTDEYLYEAKWSSETNDISFTIGTQEEEDLALGYEGTMTIDGESVPIAVYLISPGTSMYIALQSAGTPFEEVDEFIATGSYKQRKDKLTFEVYNCDNSYFKGEDIEKISFKRNSID